MFWNRAESCGTSASVTVCGSTNICRRRILLIAVTAECWTVAATSALALTYEGVDLYTITVPDDFSYPNEYGALKAGGAQVVGSPVGTSTGYAHALLWNPDATVVDLHPTSLGIASESKA